MIIKSEFTGKTYNTVDECIADEKSYFEEQEKKKSKEEAKEKALSNEKKQYAAKVDKASAQVEAAYAEYEKAKEEAKKILEESNAQVEKILNTAKANIKEAENVRFNAISDFNKKFGTYTKVYEGNKATQEYNHILRMIEDMFTF